MYFLDCGWWLLGPRAKQKSSSVAEHLPTMAATLRQAYCWQFHNAPSGTRPPPHFGVLDWISQTCLNGMSPGNHFNCSSFIPRQLFLAQSFRNPGTSHKTLYSPPTRQWWRLVDRRTRGTTCCWRSWCYWVTRRGLGPQEVSPCPHWTRREKRKPVCEKPIAGTVHTACTKHQNETWLICWRHAVRCIGHCFQCGLHRMLFCNKWFLSVSQIFAGFSAFSVVAPVQCTHVRNDPKNSSDIVLLLKQLLTVLFSH